MTLIPGMRGEGLEFRFELWNHTTAAVSIRIAAGPGPEDVLPYSDRAVLWGERDWR